MENSGAKRLTRKVYLFHTLAHQHFKADVQRNIGHVLNAVQEIKVCSRVTAQEAGGRLLTMEVPFCYYGNPRAIRNVVALRRASSPSASVFPATAHFTNFPYSFIIRGMGPGRNSNCLTPTTRI